MGSGRSVDSAAQVYQNPLQNPLTPLDHPIPGVAIPVWADLAAVIAALGTDLFEVWDADVLASLTLVTVDHVSAWAGQKAGVSLAQGTDARRPQYLPTGWNGAKPCVFYEGTALRNLVTTSFAVIPTGATPFEVWMLVDQPNVAGTKTLLQWPNNTAGQNVAVAYFLSGALNRYIVNGMSGGANVGLNADIGFAGQHVTRGRWEAAALYGGIDGNYPINKMTSVAQVLAAAATGTFALGSQSSNGAFWGGSIRKLFITKPLTDVQAASLYNYLTTQI